MTDEEIAKLYGLSAPPPSQPKNDTDAEIAKLYGLEDRSPQQAASAERTSVERSGSTPGFAEIFKILGKPKFNQSKDSAIDRLKNEFMNRWTHPDTGAQTMFDSLGGQGGLTRAAIGELYERLKSLGAEGMGADEWKAALKGKAKSTTERLNEGVPEVDRGWFNTFAGNAADALSDPGGAFFAGTRTINPNATLREYLTRPGAMRNFALQNAEQAGGLITPVAKVGAAIGGKAAKFVYTRPFKVGDKAYMEYNSHPAGPSAYSDYLWNKGKPLVGGFSKNNSEIADELQSLPKEAWSRMQEQLQGVTDPVDLAPSMTNLKQAAGESAIDKLRKRYIREANRNVRDRVKANQTAEIQPNSLATPEQVAKLDSEVDDAVRSNRSRLEPELDKVAADKEGIFERTRRSAEDKAIATAKKNLKTGFRGEENARYEAADRLKSIIPDFEDLINENLGNFKKGNQEEAIKFFDGLIDDALEGPRDLETLHALGSKYGRLASGSEAFGTNQYKTAVGNKFNTTRGNQAGSRSTIKHIIDNKIEEAAGVAGNQAVDPAAYAKANRDYQITRRGTPAAIKVTTKAEATPPLSALDTAGLVGTIKAPFLALPILAKKIQQATYRSPRFATGAGMLMNDASKSAIWDNMLRHMAMDSTKEK